MAVGVNGTAESGSSDWQSKVATKQSAQSKKIPRDWLLPATVTETLQWPLELHRNNLMNIFQRCEIMSQKEISITEDYTVDQLLAAMQASKLTALEAIVAFSKRAAIAGQLVSFALSRYRDPVPWRSSC